MNTAIQQSTTLILKGAGLAKQISLANNKGFALVDDEDYEWLSQYKWHIHSGRYAATTMYDSTSSDGRTVMMHRMILGEDAPTIDHRSGDGLDNTRANLRRATYGQNNINAPKQRNNTSGYRGVSRNKGNGKWQVHVGRGKEGFKGYFKCIEDAVKVRDEAARSKYGDFPQMQEQVEKLSTKDTNE